MKNATVLLTLVLAYTVAADAAAPVWISFYDWELQRVKRAAIAAINSPEVWARFPRERHQRHYTPIIRDIAFGFSTERGKGSTVEVIIPTTHFGPRHRAAVHVIFDQGLKITRIAEAPEI